MTCPHCGGGDLRNLRLLHEIGTSTGTSSTTAAGIGFIGDSWGAAGARATTSRVDQTNLARRVAPPEHPSSGCATYAGCAGFIAFFVLVTNGAILAPGAYGHPIPVLLLLLGILFAIYWWRVRPNHAAALEQWQADCERWERSYLCMRCGRTSVA
jgi:hypothetical protein